MSILYPSKLSLYPRKSLIHTFLFIALTAFSINVLAETDEQLMQSGQWRDPATGLIWMRCSVGQTWTGSTCIGDPLKFKTWEAAQDYLNQTNTNLALEVKNNWRVPQIKELVTIRKCSTGWRKIGQIQLPEKERRIYGQDHEFEMKKIPSGQKVPTNCADDSARPTLDTHIFPNTPPDGEYWSSSVPKWKPIGYKYKAWRVNFKTGFLAPSLNYTDIDGLLRAVRNNR
jgi:hypothetical protein